MQKDTPTLTDERINGYARYLYERERAVRTIQKYTHDLRTLMEWKEELTLTHAPASVNVMLAAVNGYLDYWKWNGLRLRPLRLQQSLFRDEEKEPTKGEYARLVSAAQQQGEHRLCLVIQTICATGIRVSELKFITVEAVELGRAEVSNKGKRRTVFLPHNLQRLLQAYLQAKKSPPERCLSPGAESRWTGQMYGGI